IPGIANHHERLDGKGYPHGIKGAQIPLIARMIGVADTFDALTSNRPYRKSFPLDKAFQIMEDVKGTQLCPDCVQVLLDWFGEKKTE
ncbi:MAG: HD domain-containing phosphohydrolase, partial [Syntrophobacteraceae bacterium]|nr:HD-GYP domain-containing protein [Desulfobacteraceae bacterium]